MGILGLDLLVDTCMICTPRLAILRFKLPSSSSSSSSSSQAGRPEATVARVLHLLGAQGQCRRQQQYRLLRPWQHSSRHTRQRLVHMR